MQKSDALALDGSAALAEPVPATEIARGIAVLAAPTSLVAFLQAGAQLIVMEAVPAKLAAEVTAQLSIPTIGIGAGVDCSGQVLVLQDMINIYPGRKAKFVRNFMEGQPSIEAAIRAYVAAVKDGSFPAVEHTFSA